MILLEGCTRIRVEGVVLRKHSRGWTVKAVGCEDMNISNMKIVGSHSYNDDGIDLCNSRNVKIDGCFIRTNDEHGTNRQVVQSVGVDHVIHF